jgi:hypothetical protein
MTRLLDVLSLARWAPSGDNTQPWRFVVESGDRVVVLGRDTRDHCVYDLDGHPSQISLGALLETIVLAATRFGLAASVARRVDAPDAQPTFDITFTEDPAVREDPLVASIETRRVQRRPMRTTALSTEQKDALEKAVAPNYRMCWFEGWRGRRDIAWLNFVSARLRLVLPEAYDVHRSVIEWNARHSVDRIPSEALGAGGMSLRLMRWAMGSWSRIETMNRFFAGTVLPRVELDLVPGLACAAHGALIAQQPPRTVDDYVAAGRAVQRLWLTAARLGLQFQPEYTPLIFARYARTGVRFSRASFASSAADDIAQRLDRLLGADAAARAVFMGRLGSGPPAEARSLRLPLDALLVSPGASAAGARDAAPSAEHRATG